MNATINGQTSTSPDGRRWEGFVDSFVSVIRAAGSHRCSTDDLLRHFLDACESHFGCAAATVWSVDPKRRELILLATLGIEKPELKTVVLESERHLSGLTLDRKLPTLIRDILADRQDKRVFAEPQLAQGGRLAKMISLPVLNTFNPNQVLLIVDLFFRADVDIPADSSDESGESLQQALEEQFAETALLLGTSFETRLQGRCIRFANRLLIEGSRIEPHTPKTLLKLLADVIQRAVECDRVAVYLEKFDGEGLEIRGAVGEVDAHDKTKNLKGGPIERCWQLNQELLTLDISREPGVNGRPLQLRGEILTGAFVPLRDFSGKAMGAIRCANRCFGRTGGALRPFTYEHIAVIEAISQAFASQLDILKADRRRIKMLSHLAHEIRVPVVAFRAVADVLNRECRLRNVRFPHDYFDEIGVYTEVMNRQLRDLDIARATEAPLTIDVSATLLNKHVIAPAVRFVAPLLRQRRLSDSAIACKRLDLVPTLYLDRALMTQVVFNLLDNAIKYYRGDRAGFKIEIEASETRDWYELAFRDHGMGIPKGFEEKIFEEGTRAPNVLKLTGVMGRGIGCWVCRTIIERHGGELLVRSNSRPTELVVRLPKRLAWEHPPEPPSGEYDG